MYECFAKNAGPYIKLGQMVGQLHMLLPQEYLDTFEPMCMQAPRTKYDDVKRIVEKEFGKPLEEIYDCKTSFLSNVTLSRFRTGAHRFSLFSIST
jgi:predicted unusual protein kinase regulating ubiquinone biosynthesis (AarF/ABC1/UbiB family)